MARRIAAGLVSIGLMLGACGQSGPDKVDDDALAAVAEAVAEQLNEPPAAIYALLRSSAQKPQVGWDVLFINLTGDEEAVNWWLQRRGLIELAGAQFVSRAAFILSKNAQELLASPDEPWFDAAVTGEPEVDCKTPAAIAASGCEISVEITPALTARGRSVVGADTRLQPMTIHAVVTLGPEDWEISNLAADGLTPRDVALTAMLGPQEAREALQLAANDALRGRMRGLSGEVDAPINLEAYTPPNYIDSPPPVAPVVVSPAGGRVDSPFRPGR